jgi:putative membrane protein
MSTRLRWPLVIATMLGLAAALWAFGREGWAQVLASAARTGVGGFALLCLVTILTFVLLGGAWLAAVPGEPVRRIGRFAWARAARDAANDLLPFSQLGALVVGARTLMAGGIGQIEIYAAMVVDLTTEMAAQLIFTLFALWAFGAALAGPHDAARLLPILWAGLGVATAIMLAFLFLQRPAIRFAAFLAARLLPNASLMADGVGARLSFVYAHRGRVLVSFLLNLAAWGATAFWSWLALRLMGVEVSLWRAAALESAIFALRSAAFLVPGALGVQEAGYALLAPLVAIDPAAALALSLVRRARDVVVGVPTLLIWQAGEMRGSRLPFRHSREGGNP